MENHLEMKTKTYPDDLDRPLCYMFNDKFKLSDLIWNTYVRYNEIRQVFYNNDLSNLSQYCVIINSHADGPLGTSIIHKSLLERFEQTDDYNFSFNISDYNVRKQLEDQPLQIDLTSVDINLPQFKGHNIKSNWFATEEGKKQLSLKTNWHVAIKKNKCYAVLGERACNIINYINDENDEKNPYDYVKENNFTFLKCESIEEAMFYLLQYYDKD